MFTEIIPYSFTKQTLHQAYMPFIKGGGLFIRSQALPQMGQSLKLAIQLPDKAEPCQIAGKVVWLTPAGSHKPAGFGLQLLGEVSQACHTIETCLDDLLQSPSENPLW